MESEYDAEQSDFNGSGEEELSLEGSETERPDAADAAELKFETAAPDFYDPEADEQDERWMARQRRGHTSDAVLSCPLCFTTLCLDCQQHEHYDDQFRAMFVMNCRVLTREAVRVPAKPKRSRRRHRQGQQVALPQMPSTDAAAPQQAQQEQQPAWQQEGGPAEQPGQPQQGGAAAAVGQQQVGAAADSGGEILNPVQCAACGTEVGLRDGEGVYHFFNVFASNA